MEILKGSTVIRTIKWKAPEKNGLHRTSWYMDEKGVQGMRRGERRGTGEPGGVTVLPGKYKVRFSFGDQKDSTEVEVKYDPRIELSNSAIQARYQALKNLEAKAELGSQAVERLKEAIKIAKDIQGNLKKKDEKGFKEQLNLCKKVIDSLNVQLDVFVGKEDERQGIVRNRPNAISNYYGAAYGYTSGGMHAPGDTEIKLISKFETELAKGLQMVNGYFNTEWVVFRETVEKLDTSPFKNYSEIKK